MMLKINLLDMVIHGNVSGVDNKKFGRKKTAPKVPCILLKEEKKFIRT